MTYRQFMWGLNQGIIVLGSAGGFWIVLGLPSRPWWAFVLVGVGVAALLYGATTVRRRATGFGRAELKTGNAEQRQESRRWLRAFVWISVAQWVLCLLLVRMCVRTGRDALIWPCIGIVMGLHFIPLGRISRVPPYYALGLACAGFSLAACSLGDPARMLSVGVGNGITMWLTTMYLIANADRLAHRAVSASRDDFASRNRPARGAFADHS